jgi:hypothetical protein
MRGRGSAGADALALTAPPWPGTASSGRRIDASLLALLLLGSALFPRVLTALGAPAVVNFAHFAVALPFLVLAAPETRDPTAKALLAGMTSLLLVILVSALLGGAGVLNAALDFLLLAEPFMLIALLISTTLSARQLRRFHVALLAFAAIHVMLAHVQVFALGYHGDDVKGVFLRQGAGHHVGGAVALTAACYLLLGPGPLSMPARAAAAAVCALETILSDSKQVIAVFLACLIPLAVPGIRRFPQLASIACVGIAAIAGLWLVRDVFPLWNLITDTSRLTAGLELKLSIGPRIAAHFTSPTSWFVGLGPGHTVGRLATLIPDYLGYLEPLAITSHPLTRETIAVAQGHYMTNSITGSSVWSPLFFWAGLWGDLGLAGVCAYVGLWAVVWFRVCASLLSRYLVLTVFAFGAVFAWLEEPGYMLFVAAILGVEHQRARALGAPARASAPPLASAARVAV